MPIQSISYNITRHISSNEFEKGVSVFKEEVFREGAFLDSFEGLVCTSDLETLSGDQSIPRYQRAVGNLGLYTKDILEFIRTHVFSRTSTMLKFDQLEIKKPYAYILEHGMENAVLLFISHSDHYVYDLNLKLVPQAVHFDYMNGQMDNVMYDLSTVLNTLKERDDIIWGEFGAGIQQIPYYNRSNSRQRFLDFDWAPSDEDWQKVMPCIHNIWNKHPFIVETIFGLRRNEPSLIDESDEEEGEE